MTKTGRSPSLVIALVLGIVLWSFALFEAFIKSPQAQTLLEGFNAEYNPLSLVIEHSELTLAIFAVAGALLVLWQRSRLTWSVLLLWIPLILGGGLLTLRLLVVSKLVEQL